MLCDKVQSQSGSSVTGVEVRLEWGITDLMDNGKRKSQTRYLYVQALSGGCEQFTENWQPR